MIIMPKRPSDDFLDKSEERYILYATDIARAVICKRLLERYKGDNLAACDALLDYMSDAVANKNDKSGFCERFLKRIEGSSFNNIVLLVDRMDFSLCRKILTELIVNPSAFHEKKLVFEMNEERGAATHDKSSIHRMNLLYKKWVENREVLRNAAITYSSYLGPDTRAQIDDYYDGIPTAYVAPGESVLAQVDMLLSSRHWKKGLDILLDHCKLGTPFSIASAMEKKLADYYMPKDAYGNRINGEKVDSYIDQNMGGNERSQKAIEILALHFEKYALVRLEQFSGDKYISYLEKIISKFGSNKGRHYITLADHITDPKLARAYQRKGYSLGASLTTIDIKGHFEDYCELTPVDWFNIAGRDRDFFGAYMDKEKREILNRKEEEAYRTFLSELPELSVNTQVEWLKNSAKATKMLTDKSPIVALRNAILEEASKNMWAYQLEVLEKRVHRNSDGTYSLPFVDPIVRRDVPEYQQYLEAYEDFCKKDAQKWEMHQAFKLEEGTAYLSRAKENICREREALSAEYKKLCSSHSPKNQVLQSMLELQRRIPEVKKQVSTASISPKNFVMKKLSGDELASNYEELKYPNKLGPENYRLFYEAYTDPKPEALTVAFRACNQALNEFDALEKEIKAKVSQLRGQIHTASRRRGILRVAAVVLLVITGYFSIQGVTLNKANGLIKNGDLVGAYSLLDKFSAIYDKADARRAECLSLIRKTMVENGYRGNIEDDTDLVYPENPVTGDPTVQSNDMCVYRKPDGNYMTQFGAYWGEVRAPEGKELLIVHHGEYSYMLGICTDGTRVQGGSYWETHPKVVQATSYDAAMAGIDLEAYGEPLSGFKIVWINGSPMILMDNGSITDVNGGEQYTDVIGFVSSRDDPSVLVPLASDGSYAQPYWVSYSPRPFDVDNTDVYDYDRGYCVMHDGRAFYLEDWQKGNDYLFVADDYSYITVYDSVVQEWLSAK